jgi:hypothetical protein
MAIGFGAPFAMAWAVLGAAQSEVVRPFELGPATEAPDCWASSEMTPSTPVAWAVSLAPLRVHNVNTGADGVVSLYRPDGMFFTEALV